MNKEEKGKYLLDLFFETFENDSDSIHYSCIDNYIYYDINIEYIQISYHLNVDCVLIYLNSEHDTTGKNNNERYVTWEDVDRFKKVIEELYKRGKSSKFEKLQNIIKSNNRNKKIDKIVE